MIGRLSVVLLMAVACLLFAAGFYAGFDYERPKQVTEVARPAQRLPDGALLLERKPDALPVANYVPSGMHVQRVVKVQIEPARLASSGELACSCKPLTLDMSLLQGRDGERIAASTRDGTVVGGVDSPLLPDALPASHPWVVGLSYAGAHRPGVFVDRDLGALRLGVELNQTQVAGLEARARLGWRF